MKALRTKDLEWSEAEVPRPGKGYALIKVKACGLNRADLMQQAGHYPPPAGITEVLGLEASGVIEQINSSSKFKAGDRVFCLLSGGAFAEYVTVPEEHLMLIPENLSFEQAAAIPEAYFTAYLSLFKEGDLQAGQKVFVNAAASGVGIATVQLAILFGAQVYACAGSDHKCSFLRSIGAIECYNYKTQNQQILTLKDSIDLVIDLVGSISVEINLSILKKYGKLIMLSAISGKIAKFDLLKVLRKNLLIKASTLRDKSDQFKAALRQDFESRILPYFNSGKIEPVLFKVLPAQEIIQAFDILSNNLNIGKVVIKI